jgi:hypothetical protein
VECAFEIAKEINFGVLIFFPFEAFCKWEAAKENSHFTPMQILFWGM